MFVPLPTDKPELVESVYEPLGVVIEQDVESLSVRAFGDLFDRAVHVLSLDEVQPTVSQLLDLLLFVLGVLSM